VLEVHKRLAYWTKAHPWLKEKVDSETNFFKLHLHRFENKKVLEIGPGAGRQYKNILNMIEKGYVADICQNVVDEYENGLLLKLPNYMQNLPQKVDIVHCWYVVHHVRVRELKDFFDFVYRQLKPRGYFLFNYPDYTTTKNPGNFGDTCWGPNGTAKHTRDSIVGEIRGTIIDEKSGPGHTQNFLTQL